MIEKYNNFFSPDKHATIFNTIINSNYRIGWEDTAEVQRRTHPNLHSYYSFEDIKNLKIIDIILDNLKSKNITINNYDKCIINLTKNMDVNFTHTHPNQIVFLYYPNLTWNPEWGGETVFYKDDYKDILKSNIYLPNTAIVFDGSIPHTIKSQNILGPSYRFTMSLFFNK